MNQTPSLGLVFCCFFQFTIIIALLIRLNIETVNAYWQKRKGKQCASIADHLSWQVSHNSNVVPFEILQEELMFFDTIKPADVRISNIICGLVNGFQATFFDFQYVYHSGHGDKKITAPKTFLLLNVHPNHMPHFWFSDPTWLDQHMANKGWISAIVSKSLVIQGPELDMIRTIFNDEAISYYEDKQHVRIRAKGRWCLISLSSTSPKAKISKELVLDYIAEGKYFLELMGY